MGTERPILEFHEESLAVSDPGMSRELRHNAQLHFHITNPSPTEALVFDGAGDAAIELSVNVGSGASNMFNQNDGTYGKVTCTGGFTSKNGWESDPLKKGRITCRFKPSPTDCVRVGPLKSISFTWTGIVSTAPEGFTTLTAKLKNVLGVGGVTTLSGSIYKKSSSLGIDSFYASPSSGAVGDRVRLTWSIENALTGTVLPGGFDAVGKTPQRTSAVEVVLDPEIDSYFLSLSDKIAGAFARAGVFIMPPEAKVEIVDDMVTWETHFANTVELTQGGEYRNVDPSGKETLVKDADAVTIRCGGAHILEHKVAVPRFAEMDDFRLVVRHFDHHAVVTLHWTAKGAETVAVKAWDTGVFTIADTASGSWTQAYGEPVQLRFVLQCTDAGGTNQEAVLNHRL